MDMASTNLQPHGNLFWRVREVQWNTRRFIRSHAIDYVKHMVLVGYAARTARTISFV